MDTLVDVKENSRGLVLYAAHWGIIESAASTWHDLPKRERKKLVRDLLGRVESDKKCESKFFLLRSAKGKMTDKQVLELATKKELGSQHVVFAVAAIYLALYYSKPDGAFDIGHFPKNYRDANRS